MEALRLKKCFASIAFTGKAAGTSFLSRPFESLRMLASQLVDSDLALLVEMRLGS
jgi:hypothetical protein